MSAAVDQDMMDTLTPEERDAILGDDMDPAERAALERIAASAGEGDAEDSEDDDGDEDGGEPVEAAAAQAAADGAQAAAAEPPAAQNDEAAAPARRADPAPYSAQLPEDFDDQVKSVADQEADLKAKFRAGEIEFDEFEEQREALIAKREALNQAKVKAEIAQEMAAQAAERSWVDAVNALADSAAKPENGGIDYRTDAEKAGDLDTFIRTLSARADNAGKPMEWFLQEAHRRVLALHGISAGKPAAAAPSGKPADPVRAATEARKPPVDAVPKTIAGVPGGDGPGDVANEFSDLDGLEGWELEQALGRMTPAQRERYAKAA